MKLLNIELDWIIERYKDTIFEEELLLWENRSTPPVREARIEFIDKLRRRVDELKSTRT